MEPIQKNTLGAVAFWLSIIGVILSIFVIGLPLLVISLVVGIIAAFKTPRKFAVTSIIISGISLLFTAICVVILWTPLIKPMIDFTTEMENLKRNNVEFREAMEDPEFQNYFSHSINAAFLTVDWSQVINKNDSRLKQTEKVVKISLDLVKEQIPLAIEEWKSVKLENQNTLSTTNPLANTSRELVSYNDDKVEGNYILDFSEDRVSTQFCNRMSGIYGVSEDNTLIHAQLASTEMACDDDEKMELEYAFGQMMVAANFAIPSTRMAGNNTERLLLSSGDNSFGFVRILSATTPTPNDIATDTNVDTSAGLANPASVNCIDLGGELEIVTADDLSQSGICKKDGKECEEWALYNGECSL